MWFKERLDVFENLNSPVTDEEAAVVAKAQVAIELEDEWAEINVADLIKAHVAAGGKLEEDTLS